MKYAKAYVGSLITGMGSLVTALSDSNLTLQEGLTAGIAALTALGLVWGVSNAPASDKGIL